MDPDIGVRRPIAVVTGATRGIGRAVAIALARHGSDLVITGRSTIDRPDRRLPGTLDEVRSELESMGATVEMVAADLADETGVDAVVAATNRRFGRCDVLVNNAAISYNGPFVDIQAARVRKAISIDLIAPMTITHGFLRGMIERGWGQVINISSRAAVQDGPSLTYGIAKTGIERFTIGLAAQLEGTGVTCTCIRIDELVLTEAVELTVPRESRQQALSPETMGSAVVWLVGHRADLGGRVLTIAELRAAGALS